MNIGDIVRFKMKDRGLREFECEGIIYGRVTDHGGKKWLIKEWKVINPPLIGIRKVSKK